MLDHVGIVVADYAGAKAFYTAALKPLGIALLMEVTPEMSGGTWHGGFGSGGMPYFWIGNANRERGGVHIAFTANTRAEVDAFYQAALAAGARDNGQPGPRPHYHKGYYGAFVLDADGNNIEAVCHKPA